MSEMKLKWDRFNFWPGNKHKLKFFSLLHYILYECSMMHIKNHPFTVWTGGIEIEIVSKNKRKVYLRRCYGRVLIVERVREKLNLVKFGLFVFLFHFIIRTTYLKQSDFCDVICSEIQERKRSRIRRPERRERDIWKKQAKSCLNSAQDEKSWFWYLLQVIMRTFFVWFIFNIFSASSSTFSHYLLAELSKLTFLMVMVSNTLCTRSKKKKKSEAYKEIKQLF